MIDNLPFRTINHRKSFTLIELLVVLALVAILSVVVVMTLNPAELIKQARDSNRLSDLATINTALNLFSADVTSGFTGTSTVVYVSIPDTSPTCANLGLPALPTSTVVWTYNCVTSSNLRNINSTGWIPVNFQRISSNSPISQLPVDPINTTSSGNYYTYVTGGSWMLTAIPESQKQKNDLSNTPQVVNYPGVIGMGNNLNLSPLYNVTGLVGYWKFDEGSGTTVLDSSGNGNSGSFAGTSPTWSSGKIGGALRFNVSNQKVTKTLVSSNPSALSVSFWFNVDSINTSYRDMVTISNTDEGRFHLTATTNHIIWYLGGGMYTVDSGITPTPGQWYHVVGVYDSTGAKIYVNGVYASINPSSFSTTFSMMTVGNEAEVFNGAIDDVRYYTRTLSAAEILAIYNAAK